MFSEVRAQGGKAILQRSYSETMEARICWIKFSLLPTQWEENASRILEPLILLGFVVSFDLLSVSKGSELFPLASSNVGSCPRKCDRHGGATLWYLSHTEQPKWKRENGQK